MKLNRKFYLLGFIIFCAIALVAGADHGYAAAAKAASTGMLYAASDGKGEVRLLLLHPFGTWPAGGWRLEEAESRRVVREKVMLGNPADLQKADARIRKDAEKLIADLAKQQDSAKRNLLYAFAMGRVVTDWEYAQALGLGLVVKDVPAGKRHYRAIGLDAKGQPLALRLDSGPLDGRAATPLPEPPRNVKAESGAGGVSLFWQPDKKAVYPPVLGHIIERTAEGGTLILTEKPLMVSLKKPVDQAVFVDQAAPAEQQVRYAIFSLDALGRKSRPSEVEVFHEDLSAITPPNGLTVIGDAKGREINWQLNRNSRTTGYLVERSPMINGPYEVLTPAGLPPDANRFRDPMPPAGDSYYRIRSVGPRGNVGVPSEAVLVLAKNAAPPKPDGLRVEPGITRILVTWENTPGSVGYIIERRVDGKDWIPLNSVLFDEPRYEDHIGRADSKRYEYRVSAVAFGEAQSPLSNVVSVVLSDALPPEPPRIIGASGADGRARLQFEPAPPENDTATFLVLRGKDEKEIGLVIGDPLSGEKRSFEDGWVNAGETYWYRLVALDAAGNRSDPGSPVAVKIGSVRIPVPEKPGVSFKEKPFAHSVVSFAAPPAGLSVMVEAKGSKETRWRHLAGPLTGREAVDAAPEEGIMQYRIRYRAGNDMYGEPSPVAELTRGKQ